MATLSWIVQVIRANFLLFGNKKCTKDRAFCIPDVGLRGVLNYVSIGPFCEKFKAFASRLPYDNIKPHYPGDQNTFLVALGKKNEKKTGCL